MDSNKICPNLLLLKFLNYIMKFQNIILLTNVLYSDKIIREITDMSGGQPEELP